MASKVTVSLDGKKLYEAVQESDGLPDAIQSVASRIASNANALGSSFRTGIFHDHETGETLGDTQPQYGYDVARKGRSIIGIVMPKNYAAMKDTHENNTLLKSI